MTRLVEYATRNAHSILSATTRHFTLFAISMLFAIIIGVGLSIVITREGRERFGKVVLSITAAAQAVPSVAVVALAFLFIGIGERPAIVALILYSLVPIVFNATSGILSVEPGVIQAARGMGFTERQRLWRIKIPLSMPVIMSGIRSAATINIGTVTVAAVIGGGGLGDLIYTGLSLNRPDMIFIGAALSALMAIAVDTILATFERKVTPKGVA